MSADQTTDFEEDVVHPTHRMYRARVTFTDSKVYTIAAEKTTIPGTLGNFRGPLHFSATQD